jgi:hypothetical protein
MKGDVEIEARKKKVSVNMKKRVRRIRDKKEEMNEEKEMEKRDWKKMEVS